MKLLNPTLELPIWGSHKGTRNPRGIWPWRPAGFDYRTSMRPRETETSVWEGTNKTLLTPEERGNDPTGDGTKSPAGVWGPLMEMWVGRGSPQGQGHWCQQARKVPFGINPLGVQHQPYHTAPRPQGWVSSGQTASREGVQLHPSADNWIKALPRRPCPPEQDPVFSTASPSHQEAYTSL